MRIRLHGTTDELAPVLDALHRGLTIHDISRPYPDRPPSTLHRIYIDARLRTNATEAPVAPSRKDTTR